MKKLLLLTLICVSTLANGQNITKAQIRDEASLTKAFVRSTSSVYDPMDVLGLLVFLTQDSKYEKFGLTWNDIADAIGGTPDPAMVKLGLVCTWSDATNGKKSLTGLNIRNKNLSGNFNGSSFQNLNSLNCSGNKLTLLDISNNVNLQFLDCDWNLLTSLDVSKNPDLTDLHCSSNQLTDLDVSKNTDLTHLNCSDNQLTDLDVSKNTDLTDLICSINQLISLDVSENPSLWTLSCSINQLTSLNVSKNADLTHLDCYDNQLTSLDVSKNADLVHLLCSNNQLTSLDISRNTDLMHLDCYNNQLTSLDVSKNADLVHLLCSYNQLTSLNMSKNTDLIDLYCSSNLLTSLDVSKNPDLAYLDCSNNLLTSVETSQSSYTEYFICFNNQFKFSTLKSINNIIYGYYDPQATLQGGKKGYFELLDLSSEYDVNNNTTTYKWYDKATNQEIMMFAANGTFYASPANAGKTLICKMTNPYLDRLTLEYEVTITNNPEEKSLRSTGINSIPSYFKPTLGGTDLSGEVVSIYPNPTTDVLYINTTSEIQSATIFDYSGRQIQHSTASDNQINVADLSPGNYILKLQTNGQTLIEKFMKK